MPKGTKFERGKYNMNYNELREEEKDELRSALFDQSRNHDCYGYGTDYDYLSADEQAIVDNCDWPDDIPETVMLSAFGGYSFVEEDFFCNCNDYAGFSILE